jgi:hypothetical protein
MSSRRNGRVFRKWYRNQRVSMYVFSKCSALLLMALKTQANANVSESDKAIVPMRSLVKTLNPWRKEEGKVEQNRPLPQLSNTEGAGQDMFALTWRYMPAALALLKVRCGYDHYPALLKPLQLCSLLPPFRADLPPAFALYTLLILAILDLQAGDARVSWIANGCHLTGLLWLAGR